MNKKDLKKLFKEQFIELLIDVSKLNKENNAYIESKLNLDFDKLYKLSCKKIDKALCCYEFMSLRDARKVIINFKKAKPTNTQLIDLCLYYIERAYDLEKSDWRFKENFYSAIEKIYIIIFDILNKDTLLKSKFDVKINLLINEATESFGHKDWLKDHYEIQKQF
jgi:hypothetical protein